MNKEGLSGDISKDLYRPILKTLNRTISSMQNLERDLPISDVAWLDVNDIFDEYGADDVKKDTFRILKETNEYKSRYWKTERKIRQAFLSYMNKKGYLPSNSSELNSLKNYLPEMIIKGDGRIWIYSYDQYIKRIAEDVGRKAEDAPNGKEVWDHFSSFSKGDIDVILRKANKVLPKLHWLKAKIQMALRNKGHRWNDLRVKTPRIERVERPIRKFVIIKRPFPLDAKKKMPRKKIIKKPKFKTIGPGDNNK